MESRLFRWFELVRNVTSGSQQDDSHADENGVI